MMTMVQNDDDMNLDRALPNMTRYEDRKHHMTRDKYQDGISELQSVQVAKWQSLDLPQGAASVLGRSTRSLTMIIVTFWIMEGYIVDDKD